MADLLGEGTELVLGTDGGEHVAFFQAGLRVGHEGELQSADTGDDHAVVAQRVDLAEGFADQLFFRYDELAALVVSVEHDVAFARPANQLGGDFDRLGVADQQEELPAS